MRYSATAMADKLGIEFALTHRKRDGKSQTAPERMEILVGDVKDKVYSLFESHFIACVIIKLYQVAILLDDMIDTGTTLTLAARTLQEKGVKSVHALISHGTVVKPFRLVLSANHMT